MSRSKKLKAKQVYILANGDLRLSANRVCWKEQSRVEQVLSKAIKEEGWSVIRAHAFDRKKQHGFIDSQKRGIEVFRELDPDAPLIVAECVWQYSQHILPGLLTHRGPILTLANWSGMWPGLVGMLNLNGSLTKMDVPYSTIWSKNFSDSYFRKGLRQWLSEGEISHDQSHVKNIELLSLPAREVKIGRSEARKLQSNKAIMGVFDEGCMGMHNAIIPDELLNRTGVFKERLSQSALYAAMGEVKDEDAEAVFDWLKKKGVRFDLGVNEDEDLTEFQLLLQCKMYIAALRIADDFGCATIGIQYQQGLKDLAPASDLAEGMLNNVDRPPVTSADGRILFPGEAMPHFNEVDECAGLDALVTYRLWRELGWPPENTLHDLRWGAPCNINGQSKYVWVFLISGAAPPSHFIGGWKGASSERQPSMYFRLGGGTLKGVSKPGWVVWSRIFVMNGVLQCDIGVAEVVKLSKQETVRRWKETTPQWPIMHAVIKGVTRDQMMARHKSNHIQVVYVPNEKSAHRGARIKASMLTELGLQVHLCGDVNLK
ncbi:MAG: fucose isomerase [Verrucomicrobiota bacterium]|nr:fucose isomerase [Verrucomicrobiota bacterium]